MDPKLTILFLLIGVVLSLSHLGRDDQPRVKGGARRTPVGK